MPKMGWWFSAGVACVIVLTVAIPLNYLFLPPRPSSDIAVPGLTATPEQVVEAYLDALNAHDCGAAQAMSIEDAKDSTPVWCRSVTSLTDVTVKHHFAERPAWTGHPASVQVASVPVEFNLDWRQFHDDGSMVEGKTTWGYLLARDSSKAPWRIFDQGRG